MVRMERGYARFDVKLTLNRSEYEYLVGVANELLDSSYKMQREFGDYLLKRLARVKER